MESIFDTLFVVRRNVRDIEALGEHLDIPDLSSLQNTVAIDKNYKDWKFRVIFVGYTRLSV